MTDIDLSAGGKLLVVDLDLTALCGDEYGERWLSERSEQAFAAVRQAGNVVMVATARPPMTAFDLVQRIGASACAYHNGGVVDLDCEHSSCRSWVMTRVLGTAIFCGLVFLLSVVSRFVTGCWRRLRT